MQTAHNSSGINWKRVTTHWDGTIFSTTFTEYANGAHGSGPSDAHRPLPNPTFPKASAPVSVVPGADGRPDLGPPVEAEKVTINNPQPPAPQRTAPSGPLVLETVPDPTILGAFVNGLKTGAKATTNGLAKAGASAISLGFWKPEGPFSYTEEDIAYGAHLSEGIANASGTIIIGVGTGALGCVAGLPGKAVKAYDMAGNALGVARGGASMFNDGVNVGNVLELGGSLLGFGAGLGTKCFTAGTQVVVGEEFTEDGVFVQYVTANIEDIEVGDWVYSYDTETGIVEQKQVTDVFVRETHGLNYLTFSDENGDMQTIETTDEHPFFVVTNIQTLEGHWVEAKDLHKGDVFLGANGELPTLVSSERIEYRDGITVYNFTVDGNHDYFVIAEGEYGSSCILVHNSGILYRLVSGKESANRLKKAAEKAENGWVGKHGVSVSETVPPPGRDYRVAQRSEVEKHFVVHDTPSDYDLLHKTIELPKPITPETVKIYNSLFE